MSGRETDQPGAQVDLTRLSIEQLQEVRKQLDAELDHLATSFAQLRSARGKFVACAESIMETFCVDADGERRQGEQQTAVLVPLTSSLYVPGRLLITQARKRDPDGLDDDDEEEDGEEEEPAQVTVDIGTGYYVSKSPAEALLFYKDKRVALDRNLQELEMIIGGKAQNLKVVTEVYAEKMRQAQRPTASASA
jgi:prefoldin alpha subunit